MRIGAAVGAGLATFFYAKPLNETEPGVPSTAYVKWFNKHKPKYAPLLSNNAVTKVTYLEETGTFTYQFRVGERQFSVDYNAQTGKPDFSPFVYNAGGKRADILIPAGKDRTADERTANRFMGFAETPGDYTWHHADLITENGVKYYRMQLVDATVHRTATHTGAVSEKKATER